MTGRGFSFPDSSISCTDDPDYPDSLHRSDRPHPLRDRKGTDVLGSHFGDGFDPGFVFGMLFAVSAYLLIIWIDPSSRPRGSGSKQD